MSFMKPVIEYSEYFEVETKCGTEIVPADLGGDVEIVRAGSLQSYCEGEILDPDAQLTAEAGWLARLSAPGYMDCTSWSAHDSEEEAKRYLEEAFDVELDEPSWAEDDDDESEEG